MHNHSTHTLRVGDSWRGGCTCRTKGPIVENQWEAEDWGREHLAQIARIRAHIYTANPTLEQSLRWMREAEGDENLSDHDRALWKRMADEIDHRLHPPAVEQPPLF